MDFIVSIPSGIGFRLNRNPPPLLLKRETSPSPLKPFGMGGGGLNLLSISLSPN